MSRKRIVAATMIAAALGLAFTGYTITRANATEEDPPQQASNHLKSDAGYRANHQIGHGPAVFAWMDAAATLTQPPRPHHEHSHEMDQNPPSKQTDEELAPISLAYADRYYPGHGINGGGGGGGAPGTGDGSGGGGRYASNVGGFTLFSSYGGGGLSKESKDPSGSNHPAGDEPQHDSPPASSGDGSNDEPGNAEPEGNNPPVTGPNEQDPPPAASGDGGNDQPGSAEPEGNNPPASGPDEQDPPADTNPPSGEQNQDPPATEDPPAHEEPTDGGDNGGGGNGGDDGGGAGYPPPVDSGPPEQVHSVPEPATFGLLGFGIAAAAALRRRRRS